MQQLHPAKCQSGRQQEPRTHKVGFEQGAMMMTADLDLQVWLETVPNTHPSVVIPYIKGTESRKLQYRLSASSQGQGGSTRISQGGSVWMQANQATALSRFSITVQKNDQCQIELTVLADGVPAGTYRFDCPVSQ